MQLPSYPASLRPAEIAALLRKQKTAMRRPLIKQPPAEAVKAVPTGRASWALLDEQDVEVGYCTLPYVPGAFMWIKEPFFSDGGGLVHFTAPPDKANWFLMRGSDMRREMSRWTIEVAAVNICRIGHVNDDDAREEGFIERRVEDEEEPRFFIGEASDPMKGFSSPSDALLERMRYLARGRMEVGRGTWIMEIFFGEVHQRNIEAVLKDIAKGRTAPPSAPPVAPAS